MKYQDRYIRRTHKAFCIKLNVEKDKDILDKLDGVPSKLGYIKEVLGKWMKREKGI